MNIYKAELVDKEQRFQRDYFDAFIIAAESEDEAKEIALERSGWKETDIEYLGICKNPHYKNECIFASYVNG